MANEARVMRRSSNKSEQNCFNFVESSLQINGDKLIPSEAIKQTPSKDTEESVKQRTKKVGSGRSQLAHSHN